MLLAVLQARCDSTRLPRKVLSPILGRPMLARQIERVRRARCIDTLVVATGTGAADDAVARLCQEIGVHCHRGSPDDVLDRVYQAARPFAPTTVMRLTGDCPLADPAVLDAVAAHHRAGSYDYTSNALEPSFPDGLDVELMSWSCLETAWREASRRSEREHVTPYIYGHPDRFRLGSYRGPRDLSHLRWTVDEAADLAFIARVYEALYPLDPAFGSEEVLALLEREPALATLNAGIERNAGYRRSLEEDTPWQPRP